MSNKKSFKELVEKKWRQSKTICIGLDPDYEKIPSSVKKISKTKTEAILNFNKSIIDATKHIAAIFKPNSAFYEMHGKEGIQALKSTVQYIKNSYPDIPVLLDAKRADIGNTNKGYKTFAFDYLKVDAITLHPYLGEDALKPFLKCKDKGLFILVKTSNPGASEFQDQILSDGKPLYQHVAKNITRKWNKNDNCCVVVGATYPKELSKVREIVGGMPILIPGIGAQGGDLKKAVQAGVHKKKTSILLNSSRGILYASSKSDYTKHAKKAADKLHNNVLQYL